MNKKPIFVAGAVDTELDLLLEKLEIQSGYNENGYTYYECNLDGYPVVVLKTGVGTINAAISTAKLIDKYHPVFIINEGTAGSHMINLKKGDIIIGEEMISINSFKTDSKTEWINPLEWCLNDFQHSNDGEFTVYKADERLVNLAENLQDTYSYGSVFKGRIGSGDTFNRESDRIKWFNRNFGTVCEEMEGIAVYTAARKFDIPVIAFRVISNNELIGDSYDTKYGRYAQEFTYDFLIKYIKSLV